MEEWVFVLQYRTQFQQFRSVQEGDSIGPAGESDNISVEMGGRLADDEGTPSKP